MINFCDTCGNRLHRIKVPTRHLYNQQTGLRRDDVSPLILLECPLWSIKGTAEHYRAYEDARLAPGDPDGPPPWPNRPRTIPTS
jgi:hypothetical protein